MHTGGQCVLSWKPTASIYRWCSLLFFTFRLIPREWMVRHLNYLWAYWKESRIVCECRYINIFLKRNIVDKYKIKKKKASTKFRDKVIKSFSRLLQQCIIVINGWKYGFYVVLKDRLIISRVRLLLILQKRYHLLKTRKYKYYSRLNKIFWTSPIKIRKTPKSMENTDGKRRNRWTKNEEILGEKNN